MLEHIYAIKTMLTNGSISDDYSYTNDFIKHMLFNARSKFLKDKLSKYIQISDVNYQTLCIDLELVKYHDCVETIGCQILKSKIKIPDYIQAGNLSSLVVKTLDGKILSYVSKKTNQYSKFAISTEPNINWFIDNGYLYITNNTKIKTVLVSGIFNDTEKAKETQCLTCKEDCNKLIEFPIDPDITLYVYELCLKFLRTNIIRDDSNNAEDNVK